MYINLRHWSVRYVLTTYSKLRDEVLDREIFDTLLEAKVLIERWRQEYNHIRPHSSLGYRPPAPEAILTTEIGNYLTKNEIFNAI